MSTLTICYAESALRFSERGNAHAQGIELDKTLGIFLIVGPFIVLEGGNGLVKQIVCL